MSLSSTRKSVRLSANSVKVIKEISQNEVNYNGSINNIIERYKLIVENSLPDLSKYELLAIAQAYNGHFVIPEAIDREISSLNWQIDQAIQYDGNVRDLLAQGDTDPEDFIKKVRSWSYAEKAAVLHKAIAFWSRDDLQESVDDDKD